MKVMPTCLVAAAVLASGLVSTPVHGADRITGLPFATRSEVFAPEAMAATSHPLATQIALDTMRQGGSAVDAAIAANAALGLMEPTGNGIGGDLFAIVWDPKTKKLHGFNGSGRSPKSLTLEHFQKLGLKTIPPRGPLPVSVPGTVDGWFELHGRFGRLPMKQVLAGAIGYARDGHPVAEVIADGWARNVPLLAQYPGFVEQFTVKGRAPAKGEPWKNPHLAGTLEKIAQGGRDAFYKGDIARTIDAYFRANGGFLRYEDLAAHRGEWVEPASVNYRGVDVWELPPNGQGIAALQMLNILEGFDLKASGFGSAHNVHLMAESMRRAFAERAQHLGDPDFVKTMPIERLLSKEYAAQLRKTINPSQASKSSPTSFTWTTESQETTHLSIVDAQRNAVALTYTLEAGYGSKIVVPGAGFLLNNEMGDFNKKPGHTSITGDIGTGKTTLCRAVLEEIDRNTFTALVLNPFLSEEDLLKLILQDFGVISREDVKQGRLANVSKQELIETIYDFLLSLLPLRASAVLIKGGHLAGAEAVDVLLHGGEPTRLCGPRQTARHTHGVGCTLSAAIAANLALGLAVPEACERAKRFVGAAIATAPGIGHGIGAVDHFAAVPET